MMNRTTMDLLSRSMEIRAQSSELRWRIGRLIERHRVLLAQANLQMEALRSQRIQDAISEATRLAGLGQ